MSWDPKLYLRFEDHRFRPAMDLLGRIAGEPRRVFDLGCGTGAVTAAIQQRWPTAHVTGLDSSTDMLATARDLYPRMEWVQADIAAWEPDQPIDLIFSNATLQWLDHHHDLFPRLASALAPGGTLAIQMPHNHHQRAYTLVDELGRSDRWATQLVDVLRPAPVHDPSVYYELLAPVTAELDIWETDYLQVLEGDNPVAEWLSGTFIRPVLAALGAEADAFRSEWAAGVAAAYPRRDDGTTLFGFRRLFIVARTAGGV